MAFDYSALKNQYLTVQNQGRWAATDARKLTAAQIAAALGNGRNAGALQSGWQLSGGSVVRKPAAPATSKPAVHPAANSATQSGTGGFHQPVTKPVVPSRQPGGTGTNKPVVAAKPKNPGAAPGGGNYLNVRQKQPDGSWKVVAVHRSKLSPAQIQGALKNGLNGGAAPPVAKNPGGGGRGGGGGAVAPKPVVNNPGGGGGGGATNPGGGGGATGGPGNGAPSWIPPMIGLGGITADPITGRINWGDLIKRAGSVAAADSQYAGDLSTAIMQAMQASAVPQSEITALSTMNPGTGKTLYQTLYDNAMRQYGQGTSSAFGNAAARGITSSGMMNQNLAQLTSANQQQVAEHDKQYGNSRIAALVQQITQTLAEQDQNFHGAYYAALARAQNRLPEIGVA